MKKGKIIATGGLAHRLCKMGHTIFDVRPKKENGKESVFIFAKDRWLNADIDYCMKNKSGEDEIYAARLKDLKLSDTNFRLVCYENFLRSDEDAE